MRYEIDQSILDKTECSNNFGCLENRECKDLPMRKADFIGGEDITLLNSSVRKEVLNNCPYLFYSSDKLICKCPVRYFIRMKYGS
jgi:hypothetical protein